MLFKGRRRVHSGCARLGSLGYCAVRACQPFGGIEPPAYNVLSDHCPVLFEVRDEDLDP